MNNPNCYHCVYRREAPGSAHSRCEHPEAKAAIKDNPLAEVLAIFGGVGRGPGLHVRAIGVTGDPHGIARGWFNWPLDFDPTWLRTCDGFEEKRPEIYEFFAFFFLKSVINLYLSWR